MNDIHELGASLFVLPVVGALIVKPNLMISLFRLVNHFDALCLELKSRRFQNRKSNVTQILLNP